MAENLVTRGLNLIDTTEGPVQQPDALVELGLMDPEPTTPAPVDLKRIAENVHSLLERLEEDPGRDWAPSEAIDLEQIASLVAHDSWEPVLASAAESARTILAASPWPNSSSRARCRSRSPTTWSWASRWSICPRALSVPPR